MLVHLHQLRVSGIPIPKYQFAFKQAIAGELTLRELFDAGFNRHTRAATLTPLDGAAPLILLDAQLIALTRERLILSGIDRDTDIALNKIQDFAQTWICWFEAHG